MTRPAVQTRGLRRRFGTHQALEGLDLEVAPGEIVGLFGANGAGKSTTFRILCGLLAPSAGEFSLLGAPGCQALARAGIMLETPAFYPSLTAADNLEVALAFAGKRLSREQTERVLERVGLGGVRKRVGGFSQGMRRRLALALALARQPDLLILDEPTNGLDIDGIELLGSLIREAAANGTACLLSTHDWEVAERLVHRVVILDRGRLLCNAPLDELIAPGDTWIIRAPHRQAEAILRATSGVTVIAADPDRGEYILTLKGLPPAALTEQLVAAACTPESIAPWRQALSDFYRSAVKGGAAR